VIDRRYEDFIPDLKEDVREKMERIKEEAEQAQYDEVEDLAHDVKGAAGSFGFERIQNLAEEIETHARSREPEKICSEAADIIDYLERVTITFE
jgi:HPt (histidine-containing phosphotransfer) domain-containing protein